MTQCLTLTLTCARWVNLDFLPIPIPRFLALFNAGEALHLEVRIRPSPSLQATPMRVLKIVPEYPMWSHFWSILRPWTGAFLCLYQSPMLCHLKTCCWWNMRDNKRHSTNSLFKRISVIAARIEYDQIYLRSYLYLNVNCRMPVWKKGYHSLTQGHFS